MSYQHVNIPADGAKITVNADHSLNVPANPIVPFIAGDGIGVDITPVMQKVVDAAVEKRIKALKKFIGWKFTRVKKLLKRMAITLGFQQKH